MVNIANSEIDMQKERRDREDQARVLIQALNDFILGEEGARITLCALEMFQTSLKGFAELEERVQGE